MAYDEELASRVRAALAARPGVTEQKMFGGISFMFAGQICCGVLKDDLVLRVGAEGIDEALAQPHVRPFDFSGRPAAGMVYVAGDALTSDQALEAWVQRAADHAAAHPRTAKPPARAKRAPK